MQCHIQVIMYDHLLSKVWAKTLKKRGEKKIKKKKKKVNARPYASRKTSEPLRQPLMDQYFPLTELIYVIHKKICIEIRLRN